MQMRSCRSADCCAKNLALIGKQQVPVRLASGLLRAGQALDFAELTLSVVEGTRSE